MIMVWLVEHLLVICLKEDDFNYPPFSTFRKGGTKQQYFWFAFFHR
jgi:hypothetical protein